MFTHTVSRQGGFTLIELLVVVLIIGILSAVALPQYEQAVAKSRYMSLMPLLRAISDAENVYYLANGQYTLDFTQLDITMPSGAKTTTPNRIDYDKFYCLLRTGSADKAAQYSSYCNSTYENMPSLEKYFAEQNFVCWGGSDKKDRLCRSISGKTAPDRSHGGGSPNTGYNFQ